MASLLVTGGRFAQAFDPFQGLKVPEFPVVDFDAVVNKKKLHTITAKLCLGSVLKRLYVHRMQVKLFVSQSLDLNCGLHAVSVGKLSERMSDFWMVRF